MSYCKIFIGVSATVLALVFVLYAVGSGAVLVLKLIYFCAFTICFAGVLKSLYYSSSIYRALPATVLGLVIFDAGTAFFIEKRQFLDAWYVIYPVGAVAVLVLGLTVMFSSKILFKLSLQLQSNERSNGKS